MVFHEVLSTCYRGVFKVGHAGVEQLRHYHICEDPAKNFERIVDYETLRIKNSKILINRSMDTEVFVISCKNSGTLQGFKSSDDLRHENI